MCYQWIILKNSTFHKNKIKIKKNLKKNKK